MRRQLNTSKIGQDLIQITPADQSSSSGSSSNDPLGGLGGIINGIPGLSGILDNLTNSVDQGLNDLSGTILGNLTEALGVKDTYRLYTTKMCQGSFRNEDDPSSSVDIDSCFTYRDQGQGKQAPHVLAAQTTRDLISHSLLSRSRVCSTQSTDTRTLDQAW